MEKEKERNEQKSAAKIKQIKWVIHISLHLYIEERRLLPSLASLSIPIIFCILGLLLMMTTMTTTTMRRIKIQFLLLLLFIYTFFPFSIELQSIAFMPKVIHLNPWRYPSFVVFLLYFFLLLEHSKEIAFSLHLSFFFPFLLLLLLLSLASMFSFNFLSHERCDFRQYN